MNRLCLYSIIRRYSCECYDTRGPVREGRRRLTHQLRRGLRGAAPMRRPALMRLVPPAVRCVRCSLPPARLCGASVLRGVGWGPGGPGGLRCSSLARVSLGPLLWRPQQRVSTPLDLGSAAERGKRAGSVRVWPAGRGRWHGAAVAAGRAAAGQQRSTVSALELLGMATHSLFRLDAPAYTMGAPSLSRRARRGLRGKGGWLPLKKRKGCGAPGAGQQWRHSPC